jgi:threonine 3-dehydrogenase
MMMRGVMRAAKTQSFARSAPLLRFASTAAPQERILITGAIGQIGLELLTALRERYIYTYIFVNEYLLMLFIGYAYYSMLYLFDETNTYATLLLIYRYGRDNVFATDVRKAPPTMADGPFKYVDVLDSPVLAKIIVEFDITSIVHLAAILSATGEANPHLALKINNEGTQNVLELCRLHKLKLFVPSTIAVFGPSSPMQNTPDDCILRPISMYGITKINTELLAEYYHSKFGVDVRSLRYPGVISAHSLPGGGTTDYAVDIFHKAVTQNSFNCFLSEDTMLPMMYMPDLIKATMDIMEADPKLLKRRVYNLAAFSLTPKLLAAAIKKRSPGFSMTYSPDFRQKIADSWPDSIDDSLARKDWGWKPAHDIETMTEDMMRILREKYNAEEK